MDDQWLNAMSHAALAKIHEHLGDESSHKEHVAELEAIGGWGSVDGAWTEAISSALANLSAPAITDATAGDD